MRCVLSRAREVFASAPCNVSAEASLFRSSLITGHLWSGLAARSGNAARSPILPYRTVDESRSEHNGSALPQTPLSDVTKKVVSDVGAWAVRSSFVEKEMEKPNGPYRRPSYSAEPGTEILQWPSSFLE